MTYAVYAHHHTIYDTCLGCGGQKTKGALVCRNCKSDRAPSWSACKTCGTRIRAAYKMCRPCYDKSRMASRPLCQDCGQPTKQYASDYFAKRCWECEVKARRSKPVRHCEVEGCNQPHQARGMCRMHYQLELRKLKPRYGKTKIALALKKFPCQVCGYHRLPARIHRLIPGGPYRVPNIVALCSRCHDEIHAGLTPPPPAMTEDEILAI